MADWKTRLKDAINKPSPQQPTKAIEPSRRRIETFFDEIAIPAFTEIRDELAKYGRRVDINRSPHLITLVVWKDGREEFSYAIKGHAYHKMSFAFPEFPEFGSIDEPAIYKADILVDRNVRESTRDITELSKEDIIEDFIADYEKWKSW